MTTSQNSGYIWTSSPGEDNLILDRATVKRVVAETLQLSKLSRTSLVKMHPDHIASEPVLKQWEGVPNSEVITGIVCAILEEQKSKPIKRKD